jgi:hypothetical protein|tara:strand:+ start:466 stop:774 length:309 start_codon:yes stop_codon:yes gene_type:complete
MTQPTGTTPFERAAELSAEGDRRITAAYANSQLEKLLQECNTMIALWQDASDLYSRHPTEESKLEMEIALSIATEALKEKKLVETELDRYAQRLRTLKRQRS